MVAISGALVSACVGELVSPKTKQDPTITHSCGSHVAAGHTMIHRLTNTEYDNTIRDLLFTTAQPGALFESSSVGSSGFSNQSDVLTLSDQIVTEYANAAITLADGVLATKGTSGGAYEKLAGCAAKTGSPSADCVSSVISTFAQRAFRRPVDPADLQALNTVYAQESTFDEGFHDVIVAALIDPKFLFSYIEHPSPNDPTVTAPLNDYELAARLSYALWQSMPDDTLMDLAAQGKLSSDPATMQAQVERMIQDPKAASFATTWRREWASLTLLDGTAGYGGLDAGVTGELRQETQAFIQDIFTSDRSLLDLVSSDQTFLNKDVAAFYGWTPSQTLGSTFARMPIPDANRRGVLTQASIMLTVGGGESYTHPVQRGRWVMANLLCAPPPPPPAGVPGIDMTSPSNETMKQRLAEHTNNPACSGCHATMDVYGLGLENFDLVGKWRTVYAALNNTPINPSGVIPGDGGTFAGPSGMLQILGTDDVVKGCLAQKILTYALTRPLSSADDTCVANALGGQYNQPTSHFSELLAHLTQSPQFLGQQGAAQ